MPKAKPRTINVHLPEDVHRLLRTLSASSGVTYAKTIELGLRLLEGQSASPVTVTHDEPTPDDKANRTIPNMRVSMQLAGSVQPSDDTLVFGTRIIEAEAADSPWGMRAALAQVRRLKNGHLRITVRNHANTADLVRLVVDTDTQDSADTEEPPPSNEGSGTACFSSSASADLTDPQEPPAGSEGASFSNAEAAHACADSSPSEQADLTLQGDDYDGESKPKGEPAAQPHENVETWMAELFDGI